ncbi:hypothetical protein FBEOM_4596 [Fusarium beomiforme]|uniref:Uncharacterized protein n=1 Tax=Fusarium beomiforme TaxID=44412 RepID=A0A9P5AMG3_9HYPO|nr:hypothetical protein FBEOM_4596 [Fusarium beomiforme]
MHVDGTLDSRTIWVNSGPVVRRQKVWNAHLGGFLASLTMFHSWGINTDKVARCFVPEALWVPVYETMANRLYNQDIIKLHRDGSLVTALTKKESIIFETVLLILEYDYCLAYFVAQDATLSVVRTKLQLAAIVKAGMMELFDWSGEGMQDASTDTWERLASMCRGFSKPLAKHGAMWMALGLWKHAAQLTNDFKAVQDYPYMFLPALGLNCNVESCRQARELWSQLAAALDSLTGSSTCSMYQDSRSEVASLSSDQCHGIESSLFMAYLSQLTIGVRQQDRWVWTDLASRMEIVSRHQWMNAIVDYDKICSERGKDEDPDCMFAIYHGIRREKQEVTCLDWTMIPYRIVAEWQEVQLDGRNDNRLNLESILRNTNGPVGNFDKL